MTGLQDHIPASHELIRSRHVARSKPRDVYPDLNDPELAEAWHSLQLHWLATCPGYREEIKERVSAAAKKAETLSKKFDKQYEDRDYLGQEIEGCG